MFFHVFGLLKSESNSGTHFPEAIDPRLSIESFGGRTSHGFNFQHGKPVTIEYQDHYFQLDFILRIL